MFRLRAIAGGSARSNLSPPVFAPDVIPQQLYRSCPRWDVMPSRLPQASLGRCER